MLIQTAKMAIHVISSAGFGKSFDWLSSDEIPPGHQLSYVQSLRSILESLLPLIIFPRWALNLPIKRLKETQLAYIEFGRYLQEMVDLQREAPIGSSNSTLQLLVDHSATSNGLAKGKAVLTDDEIIGNAFLLLLGGHETTY